MTKGVDKNIIPKTQRVILNEVKNLNALSGCSQILRDAQDDTLGRGELRE